MRPWIFIIGIVLLFVVLRYLTRPEKPEKQSGPPKQQDDVPLPHYEDFSPPPHDEEGGCEDWQVADTVKVEDPLTPSDEAEGFTLPSDAIISGGPMDTVMFGFGPEDEDQEGEPSTDDPYYVAPLELPNNDDTFFLPGIDESEDDPFDDLGNENT